jgi:prevent-host-death family protein
VIIVIDGIRRANNRILEAKKHLSKLMARAVSGEEIVISTDGKPIARMVPYQQSTRSKRKPGSMRGKIKIRPGFNEADKQIQTMFERGVDRK